MNNTHANPLNSQDLAQARQVQRRDDAFAEKAQTKIWQEEPAADNPYQAESVYLHGFELYDLMANASFSEVFYLLFKGELPSAAEREILEKLMIGLINPGPRHPATRAAMNTGVGKTNPVHILPISTVVMGGERDCAGAIESIMRFFRKNFRRPAGEIASAFIAETHGDWAELPGFGQAYGGIDIQAEKLAAAMSALPASGDILRWGSELAERLKGVDGGWRTTGVVAAVFADLGIHPKLGGPLMQLMSAPGLLAHGFEYFTKPLTAMPYVKDEDYVIQNP